MLPRTRLPTSTVHQHRTASVDVLRAAGPSLRPASLGPHRHKASGPLTGQQPHSSSSGSNSSSSQPGPADRPAQPDVTLSLLGSIEEESSATPQQRPPPLASGGLVKSDYGKFVQFFRQASPYIEGHRGRTFVIVVPGNVSRRGVAGGGVIGFYHMVELREP